MLLSPHGNARVKSSANRKMKIIYSSRNHARSIKDRRLPYENSSDFINRHCNDQPLMLLNFIEYTSLRRLMMGNACKNASDSEESTPEHEPHESTRRRSHVRERYPGVHYLEQNRVQEGYYRGRNLHDDPECTCFGPTPDERFFVQRYPHPQVLNTTISKDLAELTEEAKVKAQELKQERIHLIRSKVKDITGKDVDLDEGALDMDSEDLAADQQVAQLFEAERVEGKFGNLLSPDSAVNTAPTPVPVSDLAPMPSNEEIFGKIDELRRQHAAEMAEFEKAQTLNRARTKQGLQEKLQARRNRRSRIQAHERELEMIQSS